MNGNGFEAIVRDYIETHRHPAIGELDYYRTQPSLEAATRVAGWAIRPDGKRDNHQRRLSHTALQFATSALLAARRQISACREFDGLWSVVDEAVGEIPGISELYVYDTALRLGAKLGLSPRRVYLHRGTREGATALGLDGNCLAIEPSELPAPFSRLEPHEIEDCLCIYKEDLKLISAGVPLSHLGQRKGCRYKQRKSVMGC